MNITLENDPETESHYLVKDGDDTVLASFIRHPNDWSIGLKVHDVNGSAYVQQRHIRSEEEAQNRIERVFDDTSLRYEVQHLRTLYAEYKALIEEKVDTRDSKRHKELTDGGLVRAADIRVEIQRDIVTAKMQIQIGATPCELRDLGLRS